MSVCVQRGCSQLRGCYSFHTGNIIIIIIPETRTHTHFFCGALGQHTNLKAEDAQPTCSYCLKPATYIGYLKDGLFSVARAVYLCDEHRNLHRVQSPYYGERKL